MVPDRMQADIVMVDRHHRPGGHWKYHVASELDAALMDVDRDSFNAIVDDAVALCPISRLFAGATITVDAILDGT